MSRTSATKTRPRPSGSSGRSSGRGAASSRQRERRRQAELAGRTQAVQLDRFDRLIMAVDEVGRRAVSAPLEAWVVAVGALLLCLVATTAHEEPTIVGPRVAILLVLAAVGLPRLVVMAVDSDLRWPCRAILGFVVWATVSAAVSGSPLIGFFGYSENGTGALFWVAVASLWALAVRLDERGRLLVTSALGVLLGLEVLAVVLEAIATASPTVLAVVNGIPSLGLDSGQPTGTFGNPIDAAALLVGGLALLSLRATRPARWWWGAVVVLAFANQLVGERFGVVILVAVAVVVLVLEGWKPAARFAGATAVGYGLGYGFAKLLGLAHATLSSSGRLATLSGATSGRTAIWRAALDDIGHHLLVGSGPGESLSVTQPLLRSPVDGTQFFDDVHNIVLEVAVTTGLIGLALLVAWAVPVLRRAHGPLALFGLALVADKLVEPLDVSILTVAVLALGAAMTGPVGVRWWRSSIPGGDGAERAETGAGPPATEPVSHGGSTRHLGRFTSRRLLWIASGVLLVPAVVLGVQLVIGEAALGNGVEHSDDAALRNAAGSLWMWPDAPTQLASADYSAGNLGAAQHWTRIWLERAPIDPNAWTTEGNIERQQGLDAAAQRAYQHALAINPWEFNAYEGLLVLDEHAGHFSAVVHDTDVMAQIEPSSTQKKLDACVRQAVFHKHVTSAASLNADCENISIDQQVLSALNGEL